MKILTLNPEATGGGANQIAVSLFKYYRTAGHQSNFLTAIQDLDDPGVTALENDENRNLLFKICQRLLQTCLNRKIPVVPKPLAHLLSLCEPVRNFRIRQGMEDFYQPATKHLPNGLTPIPNIIHGHNLFGNFFDLRELPRISKSLPIIITLHDMWMFTGHCSYSKNCDKWRTGCGHCPDLTLPPAILKDATAKNHSRKHHIYQSSKLHIATPSQWLLDLSKQSILADGMIEGRVINNGVDQNVFKPGNKAKSRSELNIPQDTTALLYAASGAQSNPYKDYTTLREAFPRIVSANPKRKMLFLCVGERHPQPDTSGLPIRNLPWVSSRRKLAKFYQAADLFLHAAHEENFPTTIIEALSCGLPCIATAVGGIPEQIEEGRNGFLVKPRDSKAMAHQIQEILDKPERLPEMAEFAHRESKGYYSLERMGQDYLAWFEELLDAA